MAFIDLTYFIAEINIPSIDKEYVYEPLNKLIQKYEPSLLRDILGPGLYAAFIAGLAAPSPEQKWIDLRDGKSFTDLDDKQRMWMGFTGLYGEDGSASGEVTHQSLIANYVYVKWLENVTTHSTGLGEAASKAENAERINPSFKIVRAWNEMSEWIEQLVLFLDKYEADYTGWELQDSFGVNNKYRKMNVFGI
jgi:hypothetical protein